MIFTISLAILGLVLTYAVLDFMFVEDAGLEAPPEGQMNCYIWEHVNHATDAYHTEGGVVVFAETEERARELANAEDGCKIHPEETPDYVREVIDSTERAFIFPNAGCC